MIENFFYDQQIRSYLLQFANIFQGMFVKTGKGDCDESMYIPVPCIHGSRDRVVQHVFSGGTQNRMFSLPCMSFYMQSLALAPERRKIPGMVDKRTTMPVGGVFPDDLTVISRTVPIPYNMTVDLSIMASNQDQMHQILEQILVLFDPGLQIQRSDAPFDWAKMTTVTLEDISNEENYSPGTEVRRIIWSLKFSIPIWIGVPMSVKDEVVRKIKIRIGSSLDARVNGLYEVDDEGRILPFGDIIASTEVTQDDIINGT